MVPALSPIWSNAWENTEIMTPITPVLAPFPPPMIVLPCEPTPPRPPTGVIS